MNQDQDVGASQLQVKLQTIAADIEHIAESYQGNSLVLLDLLRTLEQTHREIRENWFQASLPDNRQQLYALLKDIEEAGGWPYIERMRLRELLENMVLNNSVGNSASGSAD